MSPYYQYLLWLHTYKQVNCKYWKTVYISPISNSLRLKLLRLKLLTVPLQWWRSLLRVLQRSLHCHQTLHYSVHLSNDKFQWSGQYIVTSRKSSNKCLTSGRVLRLRLPTHRTQFALHSSVFIHVRLCVSAFVCVRLCVSVCVCVHPWASATLPP